MAWTLPLWGRRFHQRKPFAPAPSLFEHYGDTLANVGVGNHCHQKSDGIDITLIERYRAVGLEEDTIARTLPRQYPGAPHFMGWKEVEA